MQKRRLAFAALFPCLALTAGCETLFQHKAEQAYPPTGKLVEVEPGRRIHMDCRGEGSPTVVFQSGGDMLGALGWTPVLDKVAKTTRACAYSRAGILWSDPARGAFKPGDVARDLHAALEAAGEKAPYVLAGHSRGGLYNLIFHSLYRDEVAGLVFVDSSHPDQEKRFGQEGFVTGDYVSPAQETALALRWTGLMRLETYPVDASIEGPVRAYFPKSAAANAREARNRDKILEVAGRSRDLSNLPVVVLAREPPEMSATRREDDQLNRYLLSADGLSDSQTTTTRETVWRKLQADLSTWSSRGRLEVVPDSNHAFFFYKPDAVVDAVEEVVAAARVVTRPAPPPR